MTLSAKLKQEVETHPILKHQWLTSRKEMITKNDLLYWLSQEYFVSVDFVNWFLKTASQINDIHSKIILVQNIWEELGEGNVDSSHVMILSKFLRDMGSSLVDLHPNTSTSEYLKEMDGIIALGPFYALGALGPANEYLLKLEYGIMNTAYLNLRKEEILPEAVFFKINLEADQNHSAMMFSLIERLTETEESAEMVIEGNMRALNARMIFYDGIQKITG
ncbi:MAG: iron-containing redox enzyme family protein [Leptospiraceae bacterium]|nr:iron-containing redox enzyme family protein [Leptospiraceae bacterium]MCP5511258.1 iron-containing redox enzyme family protein [Leptospiraceae bacterium]